MQWTRGNVAYPRVHPQRSCKLGERRSPAKNGRGMPFPRVPHNLTTGSDLNRDYKAFEIISDVVWDRRSWDKTGLRPKKSVLVLQVWCCVVQHGLCHTCCHNDLEGHNNFSSTIYSFSILVLKHHHCGDQQWRSVT